MQRFGVEGSSEESVVEEPGGDHPATAPASNEEPRQGHVEPPQHDVGRSSERGELHAEVRRLEVELERYRAHAERTSKLFLSVTNYAEWVRENARRDAELALRKARLKVGKFEYLARDLERTERELVRVRDELARLQALTDETRTRLSAFLTAGLQVLAANVADEHSDGSESEPVLGDLEETLQRQLSSTSMSASELVADETPER